MPICDYNIVVFVTLFSADYKNAMKIVGRISGRSSVNDDDLRLSREIEEDPYIFEDRIARMPSRKKRKYARCDATRARYMQ